MMTLITGTPGTGKTEHVVWMLREWLQEQADAEKLGKPHRRVFVAGITSLTLPHEVAGDPLDWPNWAPDGALLIFDECQDFWPPRSASSTVPVSVQEMAKHRHRGIDIWLITQHPNLIDNMIRRLIRRHIHMRVNWAGRWRHEGAEVFNVDQAAIRKLTATSKYHLHKDVFPLYKSAELHTKVSFSVPKYVYVFFGAICLAGGAFWYVYHRISVINGGGAVASGSVLPRDLQRSSSSGSGSRAPGQTRAVSADMTPEEYAKQARPRFAGQPWTAPKYDHLTQAQQVPRPAACVLSKSHGCRCYSQQGTFIDVDSGVCETIVRTGWFDEWSAPAGTPAVPVKAEGHVTG